MKPFKIESSLLNRDAVFSTLWSFFQQVVVAASTYFILQAIRSATAGDLPSAIRIIIAFVVSLVLVYLPNTISMLYLQRWRLSSIDSFVSNFARLNFGRTSYSHSRHKSQAESWLTNESFTVYSEITNLLYQMLSTLMNSVFNILVIAWALDSRLLFWYAAAGIVLMLSNHLSRGQISSVAVGMQESRKDLSNLMLTAWDNILIGNKSNFENWHREYKGRIQTAKSAATHYDLVRSIISSATVICALLIVATWNGLFLYRHQSELSEVAALLITLPRQLQIIQSIFGFFNLTLSWTGVYSQLRELQKVVKVGTDENDFARYIRFNEIGVVSAEEPFRKFADLEEAKRDLAERSSGRFTLRGENGAGKSTLLSLLKEEFGEEAYLLPTHYSDLHFRESVVHHSDGNRLLAVFQELSLLPGLRVILLDEWDANLDAVNLEKIHLAIAKLSLDKLVIESHHRS